MVKDNLHVAPDSNTIKNAQQKFLALVQEVADHPVTVTKQGKAGAVMMSIDRLETIAVTLEILADRKAMAAIRAHRQGEGDCHDLSELDDLWSAC